MFEKNIACPTLLLHFFIWAIVPSLLAPNLPLDAIESAYWAKEWQLGYFKHPPLNAWLAEIAITVFGRHDAVLFFLSSICGFLTAWPVVLIVKARYGIKAGNYTAFASLIILFLSISVYEYNVNMSFIPFWTWSIYAFIKATSTKKTHWWLMLGLLSGLGFLGKYAILLLLLTLFIWCLIKQRHIFLEKGPYLSLIVFGVVITPHIVWLFNNDFSTILYFMNRSSSANDASWIKHLTLPFNFFTNFLTNLLPVLFATIIGVGFTRLRYLREPSMRIVKLIMGDIFIFSSFCAIAVLLLLSGLTAAHIKIMWAMPIGYCFAGILGIFLAQLDNLKNFRKRFLIAVAFFYSLLVILMIGVFFVSPYTLKKPHRLMYDGHNLAIEADKFWKKYEGDTPLTLVTGKLWPAGNIAWYHKDRPSVFIQGEWQRSPWVNRETFSKHDQLYVSDSAIADHEIYKGMCITHVKKIDWPTARSITYKKHPQVWFSILKPRVNGKCHTDSPPLVN